MKFPFNTDSYHNEPDEWISSFAVDDYNDRRIKLGLSSHYPDLHICKENKASGLSLYKMNGMIQNGDDYDVYSYNKVLEFFYQGCERIFEGFEEQLPSADINLFYNEKNSPPLVITVKFCPDIHPTESGLIRDKIWKAWTVELSAIKSFFRFFLKKSCVNFHTVWGIPKQYSRWAAERDIRNDYGGFVCYVLTSHVFE